MPSATSPTPPDAAIHPYEILNVAPTASEADIKSAWKKLALQQHPDKVPVEHRAAANAKFQTLAHAYAILSSTALRARYDATGSTSLSELASEDPDFNWTDFFRQQYAEVTTSTIDDFAAKYKNGVEERKDVLAAYVKAEGKWKGVYSSVMLSDPLEDEERFRGYIDEAIGKGEVQGYEAYVKETEKAKKARMDKARREVAEAEKHAEDLGLKDKAKKGKSKGGAGHAGLAALISQRQTSRGQNWDALLEKHGGKAKSKGTKRTADLDEPSEEAFAAMATRGKRAKNEEADGSKDKEEDTLKPRAKRATKAKATVEHAIASDDDGEEEDEEALPKPKAKRAKPASKKPEGAKSKKPAPKLKARAPKPASSEDSEGNDDQDSMLETPPTVTDEDLDDEDDDGETYGKKTKAKAKPKLKKKGIARVTRQRATRARG